MRKFTTPTSFKCTSKEQADRLVAKLKEMDYKYDSMFDYGHNNGKLEYIINQYNGILGCVGFLHSKRGIEAPTEEVFLALSAMSEGDFYAGEWVVAVKDYHKNSWFKKGDIFQLISVLPCGFTMKCLRAEYSDLIGSEGAFPNHKNHIRKATTQEILDHFNQNNNQMNTMQPQLKEETKKIVGYNLVKSKYRRAVLDILGIDDGGQRFILGREYGEKVDVQKLRNIEKLKEAGVLELWFEPVYEQEKIMIDNYEVKFNQEGYSKKSCVIEGNAYSLEQLECLLEFFRVSNGQVKYLACGCNGQIKVDLITINRIINKLK